MTLGGQQRDRPVRVCYVIDRLRVAGTETQLLMLIRGLNRTVVEPFLCLLDGRDDPSRKLEPNDCPILRLNVCSLHNPSILRAAWIFVSFLRKYKIDIVQTHFPDSTYFAIPVAKLSGVKYVVRTRRDLGYWMRPIDRWLARIYSLFTTVTVANCEACRRAVIAQEMASSKSVMVLENGINIEPFLKIQPMEASINGRPIKIGMVANLRPIKAPDIFIRAAAIVAQSHSNAEFLIAGNGYEKSMEQLIREYGISNRFIIKENASDIPSFLAGLDVAVLTSYSEGLSNALLEYMAAGRPIVATNVGGNVELITHGIHGLLVPPGNPESLANAICEILAKPQYAQMMGHNARQKVMDRFSLPIMLRHYEQFYQALVKKK